MLEFGIRWIKKQEVYCFIMSRHESHLRLALKKAKESPFGGYKHGAVLVSGGRVIAIGTNHSKRGIIFDEIFGEKNFHAEIDVLSRFEPSEIRNAVLYVAGWSEHGNVCNSRPCRLCEQVIRRYELKAVYYMDKGEIKRLEDVA